MDMRDFLAHHGHLTTTSALVFAGHSPRSIGRAIADGRLIRICRGWVATRDAHQHAVLAVLHRGILAGPSALLSRGIWDATSPLIHVQRAVNSHGRPHTAHVAQFRTPTHQRTGVRHHWRRDLYPDPTAPPWLQSVVDALILVGRELPAEQFIACVESALHKGGISRAGLGVLRALAPGLQTSLDVVDTSSESGLETLSRIRLRSWVRRLETQVWIPGIGKGGGRGRVDLLIDGWLVIELDGDEWHDPVVDRERNGILVRLGYRSHRFGHRQVIHEWPTVEATIAELLRYPPR